jgi:hypothetical protein
MEFVVSPDLGNESWDSSQAYKKKMRKSRFLAKIAPFLTEKWVKSEV